MVGVDKRGAERVKLHITRRSDSDVAENDDQETGTGDLAQGWRAVPDGGDLIANFNDDITSVSGLTPKSQMSRSDAAGVFVGDFEGTVMN